MGNFQVKEIKYISHSLRNCYLFFLVFLFLYLLYNFQPGFFVFFKGLIVFFVGYLPVYFFNDFIDHREDRVIGKRNLYSDINNKGVFWTFAVLLLLIGIISTLSVSFYALLLLLILYILNLIYTFKPFKLRDTVFPRGVNIFFIYFIKWFLILELLSFNLSLDVPLSLLIMGSSFATIILSLYKRHLGRNKFTEYFFGIIFLFSFVLSIFLYKNLWILTLPLIPAGIYLSIKHKNSQVPIGKYQLIHFIYILTVFIFVLIIRSR